MVMRIMKEKMNEAGIKPEDMAPLDPDGALDTKKIPTKRLIVRTGLSEYDVPATLDERLLDVREVIIPLKQHIGAPSVPVVSHGQKVNRGDLIADIPDGKLGARVHASIGGTVKMFEEDAIRIGEG
jgi:hypothetical protein